MNVSFNFVSMSKPTLMLQYVARLASIGKNKMSLETFTTENGFLVYMCIYY